MLENLKTLLQLKEIAHIITLKLIRKKENYCLWNELDFVSVL